MNSKTRLRRAVRHWRVIVFEYDSGWFFFKQQKVLIFTCKEQVWFNLIIYLQNNDSLQPTQNCESNPLFLHQKLLGFFFLKENQIHEFTPLALKSNKKNSHSKRIGDWNCKTGFKHRTRRMARRRCLNFFAHETQIEKKKKRTAPHRDSRCDWLSF